MKKTHQRFLSMLLAAMLLVPALAACSSGETEPSQTSAGSAGSSVTAQTPADTTAETEPEPAETAPTLSFDKQNYGGTAFHILTCVEADYEYLAEGETGERVNDAIFARNRNAEEYLNVDLDVIYESGSWANRDLYNGIITQSIMAGDNAYDYVTGMISCIQPIASTQYFYNLLEVPGM